MGIGLQVVDNGETRELTAQDCIEYLSRKFPGYAVLPDDGEAAGRSLVDVDKALSNIETLEIESAVFFDASYALGGLRRRIPIDDASDSSDFAALQMTIEYAAASLQRGLRIAREALTRGVLPVPIAGAVH